MTQDGFIKVASVLDHQIFINCIKYIVGGINVSFSHRWRTRFFPKTFPSSHASSSLSCCSTADPSPFLYFPELSHSHCFSLSLHLKGTRGGHLRSIHFVWEMAALWTQLCLPLWCFWSTQGRGHQSSICQLDKELCTHRFSWYILTRFVELFEQKDFLSIVAINLQHILQNMGAFFCYLCKTTKLVGQGSVDTQALSPHICDLYGSSFVDLHEFWLHGWTNNLQFIILSGI